MRSLFGTDGIRGRAGEYPLDANTVSRVGAALAASLRDGGRSGPLTVVIGCDTRVSSPGIVAALTGGLRAAGAEVRFAGIVPTPAVAHLVKALGADAGISVSASHNPWPDNGIKVFSGEGKKLPDALEALIERRIAMAEAVSAVEPAEDQTLADLYETHLVATLPSRLDGLKVVLDCANGAAFRVAPEAFRRAGAEVIPLAVSPDGHNINAGCGALHPGGMANAVVKAGADLGLALDGDADRAMLADGRGRILDGDDVLLLWALELEREGKKPAVVVGTVMSNWGLEEALAARGIRLVRAAVGDRYVVEEMDRYDALLGGEQSGHLIRADLTTTGDGTLTGLHVAASVAATRVPLAAGARLVRAPQVLLNVEVREKVPFEKIAGFHGLMTSAEERIAGSGRVLVRYSGTELLARVMVEGTERGTVESIAGELAGALRRALGTPAAGAKEQGA
jgi:phosphoglucosamine mutase